MRSALKFLAVSAAAFVLGSVASAQVLNLPATGCTDNGAPIPQVVGVPAVPQIPTDGSVGAFQLQCNCGVGNAGLWLWGLADGVTGPVFDWPLSDPCFSNWTNPPATCNGALILSQFIVLDGNIADAAGNVVFPFPLVDLRPTFDLAAISVGPPGFAIQFLCLNSNVPPCESVSAAALFGLTYAP